MSLRHLLGLDGIRIDDIEIMARIIEAQRRNLDDVEFNVDGEIVKISIPHIKFDPHMEFDSW